MGEKELRKYGFDDICFGNVSTRTVWDSKTEYKTIDLRRSNGEKVVIKTPVLVCRALKKEDSFGNKKSVYKFPL